MTIEVEEIKAPILRSLRELHIGGVRIKYSGSGDSGQVDAIFFAARFDGLNEAESAEMASPFAALVEQTRVTIPVETQVHLHGRWQNKVKKEPIELRDALERLFNASLTASGHSGYENNEGGQGHVDINSQAGTLHLHHEDNVLTTQAYEHEL